MARWPQGDSAQITEAGTLEGAWSGKVIRYDFDCLGNASATVRMRNSEAAVRQIRQALSKNFDVVSGEGHRSDQCRICLKGTNETVGGFIYNVAGSAHITLYSGTSRTHKPMLERIFEKAARSHHGKVEKVSAK